MLSGGKSRLAGVLGRVIRGDQIQETMMNDE